ncbi:carotenoid 1,2-hydratase [Paracraurococcus lichenis]|uniref:Carotenoid 1,2-hydratase n=1 Tax=Paracraurococcus lichenis TaxID=3064888 RepID=A0ABT9DTU5_9PROT|nr:carotenoid 1,2-hydratase [Paracraurococcus sp. LOR1-02]MDO9707316.1 carotenoid 1,2-hydratase [Paracraurococcus sp. LOR1-02]
MNAIAPPPGTGLRGWEFDRPVPKHGYAWWYLDALSEDGAHGITIIAFIGTVFSPWYAWSRRWGAGDPENHCCMNVALYGRPRRWAMTDRPRSALRRGADFLRIGPSSMDWDGTALTVRIEEVTAPLPSRISGTVRLLPEAVSTRAFLLDAAGRHRWQPIAARARAEVAFDSPALRWSGPAYFDTNAGAAPLEADFLEWDWCRAPMPRETAVLYNAIRRDGSGQSLALRVRADGVVEDIAPPPPARLPRGFWGVARPARSEDGTARLVRSLEDAPFYTRSEIHTRLLGQEATAVHESLALDRFAALPVQVMLPVRVPRARR